MPSIDAMIRDGRRRIIQREAVMTQALLDQYAVTWREVERYLQSLDWAIQEAVRLGVEPDIAWLRQQTWYRQLMASVDAQFGRFETSAQQVLGLSQAEAVRVAQEVGLGIRSLIPGNSFAGRVNTGAFERWVSIIQPGSPLRTSIERYGVDAGGVIERAITEGIGTGRGVDSVVRAIRKEIGDKATEMQIRTITRTEMMRAYRGSFRDDMEEMGPTIIHQWEWMATLSPRACVACLALDGKLFDFDQYPATQHVSCRCVVVPRVSEVLVPGANRPRKLGGEWLAEQDEKTQRRVLLSPGRYEAYQDGVPITEMVGERSNATWGPSITIKPMRDLNWTPHNGND